MLLTIRVKPAAHLQTAFAKWAVTQTPKINTCSHVEFCVPPDAFTHMPEELLIGSLVDGHPYISPDEDAETTEHDTAPDDPQPATLGGEGAEFTCGVCERPFPTERGRDTHRRRAHPEGGS